MVLHYWETAYNKGFYRGLRVLLGFNATGHHLRAFVSNGTELKFAQS